MEESYRLLYRIRVRHNYFGHESCPVLQLRLSARGEIQARRCGLLFRQTAIDEWTVLYDYKGARADAGTDVLELEMSITDSQFPLYTEWEHFSPGDVYRISLPGASEMVYVASAACVVWETAMENGQKIRRKRKRGIGTSFCTVSLCLTEQMLTSTPPLTCELRFLSKLAKWEFLFFPHENQYNAPPDQLRLEDGFGEAKFSTFHEQEVFERKSWRTISRKKIPMRLFYPNRLRLVVQNDNRQQKRILLSQVQPPEPGRFHSGQSGIIRQVCYY